MLTESEKRAAHLAVSRYGADQAQIQRLIDSVLEARSQGEAADLIDLFQREKLLSLPQLRALRLGLEKTLVEPLPTRNGAAKPDVYAVATLLPGEGAAADGDDGIADLRVLGDYRILRRLGKGGTGTVFLAYHEKENRQVALKVLAHQLAKNQPSLARFYREAKSGALLNHPNIVRNLAAGQDQATAFHYLVLEYVDGPSGLDLLDRFGKLAVGDAVHIILEIARALEYAHSRNIIHRDIKPGNILMTQSGLAKLADMGLAKRTDEASHLTHARQGFGTPYYMPYEQAMNAKYADARADIYALGATLYHLIVGEVPFSGANSLEIVDKKAIGVYTPASRLNSDVPHALDHILARMLAREPCDRYQTASELIVDLERSNLAASVPSFIDPDLAMQDPVVRQRLTSPAQTTCPDLRPGQANPPPDAKHIWYVRFKDKHGQPAKAKLSAGQIEERLRAGKLSPQTEIAQEPQGKFRPLASYVEFQNVLAKSPPRNTGPEKKPEPATFLNPAPPQNGSGLWWWLALAAVAGILVLVAITLVLFRPA